MSDFVENLISRNQLESAIQCLLQSLPSTLLGNATKRFSRMGGASTGRIVRKSIASDG